MTVAAAVVFAACGADDPPAGDAGTGTTVQPTTTTDGGDAEPTVDGSWVLTAAFLDGEAVSLVEGWDVTLTIDGTELGGTAACNGYGGTVSVGAEFELGGSFAVGELSWTEMGCEPAVMELEQRYLQILQTVDSYELANTLTLAATGSGTSLRFDALPPVPTADVVGTAWVLDTYLDGDAAMNVPGMENATLTLHADGTLVGSTGCRDLSGRWIETGSEILFTEFAADGECPSDLQELDNWVVSVLGDGFTAEVDGRRLTVTAQGGEGLSYVAR